MHIRHIAPNRNIITEGSDCKSWYNSILSVISIFFYDSDEFSEDDVDVLSDTLTTVGNDTVFDVIVNEPGTDNPVSEDIVEDALFQSTLEDNTTTISNLHLAVVNISMVSTIQRSNSVRVRLQNTIASEVSTIYKT